MPLDDPWNILSPHPGIHNIFREDENNRPFVVAADAGVLEYG